MDFVTYVLPIVILMLVGTLLLVVEVFMPGFGIPGISGIVAMGAAIFMAWYHHGSLTGLGVTLAAIALSALAVTVALRSAAHGKFSKSKLVLQEASTKEEGYLVGEERIDLVGKQGTALTVLRPSGKAEFDGERVDVVTDGAFVPDGAAVRVSKIEGTKIIVETI